MTQKPSVPRADRERAAIDEGQRLAIFLADPAIVGVLDAMHKATIEAMIDAQSAPDREREAVRVQVIRQFRAELESKAHTAARLVEAASTKQER